jgi:hypothetical protein
MEILMLTFVAILIGFICYYLLVERKQHKKQIETLTKEVNKLTSFLCDANKLQKDCRAKESVNSGNHDMIVQGELTSFIPSIETEIEAYIYKEIVHIAEKYCSSNDLELASWQCGSKSYGKDGHVDITINFCGTNSLKEYFQKELDAFTNEVQNITRIRKFDAIPKGFGENTMQVILTLDM